VKDNDFDVKKHFNSEKANDYDSIIRQIIPGYEAMHDMVRIYLQERLGGGAEVLVAGVGTGQEAVSYGVNNPGWRITGFDQAETMLSIASERIRENHLEERVELIEGSINAVGQDHCYDAATSLLIMHFIPDNGEKYEFLMEIFNRLKPGGIIALVDLTGDKNSIIYEKFMAEMKGWQLEFRADKEQVEEDMAHITRQVDTISQNRTEELLSKAGFVNIRQFYQAYLFCGYFAEKL